MSKRDAIIVRLAFDDRLIKPDGSFEERGEVVCLGRCKRWLVGDVMSNATGFPRFGRDEHPHIPRCYPVNIRLDAVRPGLYEMRVTYRWFNAEEVKAWEAVR